MRRFSPPGHPLGIKIATVPNQPVSKLLPYGVLILVTCMNGVSLLANVLERWVLRIVYGKIYTNLEDSFQARRRRSFVYHHVALPVMTLVLCT
ncbi:hypothetical protein HJFPF1_07575 [Paramyrothecium foliicola]|nr:hypothetical protein HJFPF1_07575 [Paramyrothecium foliicola]